MSDTAPKRKKRKGRFGKIYASLLNSGKLADLMEDKNGLQALGVWSLALAYSADQLTDGVIRRAVLSKTLHGRPTHARSLIAARMWEEHPDGWLIVDYAQSGITSQDVAEAVRQGEINACKRWHIGNGDPCVCGGHDAMGNPLADPEGHP